MEACMTYGRPSHIEFMAFIDRRFKRNIPIEANYVGHSVDAIDEERVHVMWTETDQKDQVVLFNQIAK